jgi:hypothetical protein
MLEFSAFTLDLIADLLDGNLNKPRQPPSARVREHGGDEPLGNSEIGEGSVCPGKIRYHEKPRARTEVSSAPRSRRRVTNSMSKPSPGLGRDALPRNFGFYTCSGGSVKKATRGQKWR